MHFAETMDPSSPMRRDLAQEEILHDMMCDPPVGDPPESPSSYLNPSGDGIEVEQNEKADGSDDGIEFERNEEADGSDDGEGNSSDDGEADGTLTKAGSGEVYI